MTLKHELSKPSSGVPELYTSILGARHDPVGIGSERYAKYEILIL